MPYKTVGKANAYIRDLLPLEQSNALKVIVSYADEHSVPILLPETAAFLKQMTRLKRPKRILEIGTAIGYSGHLMLLESPKAHLYTIEISENSIAKAKEFFASSQLLSRVTFFTGDSSEIVPMISGQFDFIFLDGPKAQYIEYLPFLSRALKCGGVLLCDNVLYNGMVSGENETPVKKNGLVKKLDLFLHALFFDSTLLSSVLPVGDGVSLSIKEKMK